MKFSRLIPLIASISTLALVAACARHEKNPKISQETMELQAAKSLRETYGNVNLYDAKNMAFAKLVEGADLVLNREVGKDMKTNSRSVDVDISILLKDREAPIVASGVISHGGPSALEFKTAEAHYAMTAQCVQKDCANLIVELSKLEEQTATLPVSAQTADLAGAGKVQVEQASEMRTADAGQAETSAPEATAPDKTTETAAPQTAATTKAIAATAKAYLQFRVPMKDAKLKETAEAKNSRLATFNLFWSSPTELGKPTSGATASVTDALKARGGKPVEPTKTPEDADNKQKDPTADSAGQSQTDAGKKSETQTEVKPNAQADVKPEVKPEGQAQVEGEKKTDAQAQNQTQELPEIVVTATFAQVAKSQLDYSKELEAKAAKEKDAKEKQKLLTEAKSWKDKAAATEAKAKAKAKEADEKKKADAKAKEEAEKAKKKA